MINFLYREKGKLFQIDNLFGVMVGLGGTEDISEYTGSRATHTHTVTKNDQTLKASDAIFKSQEFWVWH